MGFLSRLRWWQKGVFFGLIFSLAIGLLYTAILIIIDVIFLTNGVPNVCSIMSRTWPCSFSEALLNRIGFLVLFMIIIGMPVSVVAGLIGHLVEKISLR